MQKNPNPNMSNASAVGELLLDTCLFVVDKDFDVVRHIDCVAFPLIHIRGNVRSVIRIIGEITRV